MSETAIETVEAQVMLGGLQTRPHEVITRASAIASSLADIIRAKKLYKVIGGREYVLVDGWTTLGAMLGVIARERETKRLENGFESYVDLVRASDGVIIGGASAICTFDERNWTGRDEYAVRSMAITRATGKAFRLAFSWIMRLAGYEPTPAEEMIDEDAIRPNPNPKPARPYPPSVLKERLQAIRAEAIAKGWKAKENTAQVVALNLNECFAGADDSEYRRHVLLWYLTGCESKELDDGWLVALKRWLNPQQDSGGAWAPDPLAIREAQAAYYEAERTKGQMVMSVMEVQYEPDERAGN